MSLPTPTLHTARLRLRPVTSADAGALFALHSNGEVSDSWVYGLIRRQWTPSSGPGPGR